MIEKEKSSESEKKVAEYVLDRILKGYVFFLGNDAIVNIQESQSSIRFERTDIEVDLRKYGTKSKLYFLKKDNKLKQYSSDVWKKAGANWETLFGFFFENELPIMFHVYYIGKEFDLDKLSEMVYSIFTDSDDCIKITKVEMIYGK